MPDGARWPAASSVAGPRYDCTALDMAGSPKITGERRLLGGDTAPEQGFASLIVSFPAEGRTVRAELTAGTCPAASRLACAPASPEGATARPWGETPALPGAPPRP